MGPADRQETPVLYTVGHSNHPIGNFLALLAGAGIELIVDVRNVPFSRFAPQYNRTAIEKSLLSSGIGYCYLGDLLGGRPPGAPRGAVLTTDEAFSRESFREGLRKLWELMESNHCAVMCAEKDPDRCHRKHLIARAVVMMGGTVAHLMADGSIVYEWPGDRLLG